MIVEQIIDAIISGFDFSYCVTVNILTYIVITLITTKLNKSLTEWQKRIVLIVAMAIISVGYYLVGTDLKILINSSVLAPVSWSWILKPICKHFDIDYKKYNVLD